MPQETPEPTPPKKAKKTGGGGAPPLLAILLVVAAVAGGAFLRWPNARLVTNENVASTSEARESIEAAKSLLAGNGLTVERGGERKQTKLSAGEPATVAASYMMLGQKPASPLYLQMLLSTGAIALLALAGYAAAGGWGAAAASILLATWPDQIEATRIVSLTPAVTFTIAGAACGAAFALRGAKGTLAFMILAGVFAGLGAALHPICIVVAVGLFVASIIQFSFRAFLGALVGTILGFVPLLIQRSVVYQSPLVSAERHTAAPGMAGFELFSGTAGSRLADWVGVDASAISLNFDKGYFQHLYQNLPHAALFALAALSLLAIILSSARGTLAWIVSVGGALIAIPLMAGHEAGLPLTRATSGFFVCIALAGALAAGVLSKLGGIGGLLAILLALAPAAASYQDFLEVAKRAPGILAPVPDEPAPTIQKTDATPPVVEPAPKINNHEQPAPIVDTTKIPDPPPTVKPPEKLLHPATAKDLAIAKKITADGAGMSTATASIEDQMICVNIKLASKDFDGANEAVRLSLMILREIPEIDRLRVRIQMPDGKTRSTSTVLGSKARPFIEKLDDPFESRRAASWWPSIKQ